MNSSFNETMKKNSSKKDKYNIIDRAYSRNIKRKLNQFFLSALDNDNGRLVINYGITILHSFTQKGIKKNKQDDNGLIDVWLIF